MKDSLTIIDKNRPDTAFIYTRGANGLIEMPQNNWTPFPYNVSFRDTVIYNPAYLPVVFDGKILPPDLDFMPKSKGFPSAPLQLIPEDSTFAPTLKRLEQVQLLRRDFYTNMNNIENVRYNAFTLKKLPQINQEEVTKRNILHDLITAEDPITVAPVELPKIAPKFIYWTYNGEHQLQATHNFISDNWYKGGNRSFYIVNSHKLYLNYKKDKLSFQNTFEWRLNIAQVQADKVNKYSVNEDLVRLINTLGYKAFNNWEYTVKLESQTQLLTNHPINSKDKTTSFLSPLTENFAVGMKYSKEKAFASDKYKKLAFSINLSPTSLNYIYIRDNEITNRQGIAADKHSKLEFGSTINADLKFTFNRFTTWTSRFKYFTNYEKAQMEFENSFNMQLNRFFSVNTNVYLRFDDTGKKGEGDWGYFQMNEILSFGLSYNW